MKQPYIASILAALILVGCGNSSETEPATTGSATSTTSGSSSSASMKPEEQLVGTWKVDMEASKLGGMTDSEKEEGASIRTEMKADGTFETKSSKDEGSGTWKVEGNTVTFSGSNVMPPTMTLSEDGRTLTFSMQEGGQDVAIVMVKE